MDIKKSVRLTSKLILFATEKLLKRLFYQPRIIGLTLGLQRITVINGRYQKETYPKDML